MILKNKFFTFLLYFVIFATFSYALTLTATPNENTPAANNALFMLRSFFVFALSPLFAAVMVVVSVKNKHQRDYQKELEKVHVRIGDEWMNDDKQHYRIVGFTRRHSGRLDMVNYINLVDAKREDDRVIPKGTLFVTTIDSVKELFFERSSNTVLCGTHESGFYNKCYLSDELYEKRGSVEIAVDQRSPKQVDFEWVNTEEKRVTRSTDSREIYVGEQFETLSGVTIEIKDFGKHAQDCSITMVHFVNVTDTFNHKAGQLWSLDLSTFRRRYVDV